VIARPAFGYAIDFTTGPAAEALFPGEAAGFEATPALNTFEWGDNGRILRGAPVYSPFVRRKEHIDLV
jgi:hypothetical protein